jgi:hypothetical protein
MLRQALSIAQPQGGQGLNDDGDEPDLKTIEEKAKAFRKWGVEEKQFSEDRDYAKMFAQIDKSVFLRLEKMLPAAGGYCVNVKNLAAHPEGNPTGEKLGQRGAYEDPTGRGFDPHRMRQLGKIASKQEMKSR